MTKRLLAALIALLLCFCLPACGGGEESSAPLPDGITTAVTTAVSTAPTAPSTTTATTTTTTTAIQTTTSRTWSHEELYGSWKPPVKERLDGTLGRELVWSDEFEGNSLDTTKWKFHSTMSTPQDRTYDNGSDYAYIASGKLTMAARMDTVGNITLPEGITTRERMAYRYGYIEIKAKPPFSQGAWPSFWMQADSNLRKSAFGAEVDIFEIFSSKNSLVANIHKWAKGDKHTMSTLSAAKRTYTFETVELTGSYHLYGMEWTPEHMKMLVDGEVYATFDITEEGDFDKTVMPGMDGFHDFAFIIFNNEFFTENNAWRDDQLINETSVWPQLYEIDYVRLYQKSGEEIYIYD